MQAFVGRRGLGSQWVEIVFRSGDDDEQYFTDKGDNVVVVEEHGSVISRMDSTRNVSNRNNRCADTKTNTSTPRSIIGVDSVVGYDLVVVGNFAGIV